MACMASGATAAHVASVARGVGAGGVIGATASRAGGASSASRACCITSYQIYEKGAKFASRSGAHRKVLELGIPGIL